MSYQGEVLEIPYLEMVTAAKTIHGGYPSGSMIIGDTSGGNYTLTLPGLSTVPRGTHYTFKNIGEVTLTISAISGEKFDTIGTESQSPPGNNSQTMVMSVNNSSYHIVNLGICWSKIGHGEG